MGRSRNKSKKKSKSMNPLSIWRTIRSYDPEKE
jgi:Ni,Fe-hydrogenase I large subunit